MDSLRIILLLAFLALNLLVEGIALSILPPFFPFEAERKEAVSSQYGFAIGLASLATFIAFPLAKRVLHEEVILPKWGFLSGEVVSALAWVLFGLIDYVDSSGWFMGMAYILRFVQGISFALSHLSLLTVLMASFPNSGSTILALSETVCLTGMVVGPALGTVLYESGSFPLTFSLVGVAKLFASLCSVLVMTNEKGESLQEVARTVNRLGETVTSMDLLLNPLIIPYFLSHVFDFVLVGMLSTSLAVHLRQHDWFPADQWEVSAVFMTNAICYLSAKYVGQTFCHCLPCNSFVSILSHLMSCVTLSLLAPLSFLPVEPSIHLFWISSALLSLSASVNNTASFCRSYSAAVKEGCADSESTVLTLAELSELFRCFGYFTGCILSGVLLSAFSFHTMILVFLALTIFFVLVDASSLFHQLRQKHNSQRVANVQRAT